MIQLFFLALLHLPSQLVVNGKWVDTLGPSWRNRNSAPKVLVEPQIKPSSAQLVFQPDSKSANKINDSIPSSVVVANASINSISVDDTSWFLKIPDSVVVPNLAVRQADIRDILSTLAMQHGINIVIDSSATGSISLNLRNIKLRDVFKWIAQEQSLQYLNFPGVIKVRRRPILPPPPPTEPLCVAEHHDSLYSLNAEGVPLGRVTRTLSQDAGLNIVLEEGCGNPTVQIHLTRLNARQLLTVLAENVGLEMRERQGVFMFSRQPKQAAGSGTTSPQSLRVWIDKDSMVSIEASQTPLSEAVNALARRMAVNVVVLGSLQGNVTMKLTKTPFEQVLSFMFTGTEFTWWKQGDTWVVGPAGTPGVTNTDLILLNHLRAEEALDLIPQGIQKNVQLKLVKSHNGIMCLGSRESIDGIRKYVEKIDYPVPQILIEALVVDVDMDRVRNVGVNVFTKKSGIGTSTGELYPGFDQSYKVDNGNTLLSGIPGLRDIISLPKDFYFRVKAMEQEKYLKVRSRPQISTLNGSEATITLGQTQYYLLKTETDMNQAISTTSKTTQKFEKIEANITLTVTPFVTGKSEITCDIVPDFTEPEGSFDAATPPTLNRRFLKSKVRLRDGETIVLGGLVKESQSNTDVQVPFLGSIPVVGYLFKSRSSNTSRSQLLIFVTPHIYYGQDAQVDPEKLLRSLEK